MTTLNDRPIYSVVDNGRVLRTGLTHEQAIAYVAVLVANAPSMNPYVEVPR